MTPGQYIIQLIKDRTYYSDDFWEKRAEYLKEKFPQHYTLKNK